MHKHVCEIESCESRFHFGSADDLILNSIKVLSWIKIYWAIKLPFSHQKKKKSKIKLNHGKTLVIIYLHEIKLVIRDIF